jgi:hypothetical protein
VKDGIEGSALAFGRLKNPFNEGTIGKVAFQELDPCRNHLAA